MNYTTEPKRVTSPGFFIHLADRFAPGAVKLAFKRMYSGFRFFDKHTLLPVYDPEHVRIALDIVRSLRPDVLSADEKRFLRNPDPRTPKNSTTRRTRTNKSNLC